MSNLWKNWYEINKITMDRNVYLYGRSEDWVHKALLSLKANVLGIVDRETNYHGKSYRDLSVLPIESVDLNEAPFFLITAGDYDGIVDLLLDLGLREGEDFCCSPDFRDYRVLEDLNEKDSNLLVSSSDYNDQTRARSSKLGGGLYLLNTKSRKFTRMLEGSFRQVDKITDEIWAAVEYVSKKLIFFDASFKIYDQIELDFPNYCGLACDLENGICWLISAGKDEIVGFSFDSKKEVGRRKFSFSSLGFNHHINDATFYKDRLYVSYFSLTGGFKIDVFDGGVAEVNPNKEDPPVPIISDLWKPHSPRFFDNKLYVLDSMRGHLRSGKSERLPKLPGFIRGLAKEENFFFIGQSSDMYVTERMQNETVLLNAGIYICEHNFNATRFIELPGLMNVHDIHLWK